MDTSQKVVQYDHYFIMSIRNSVKNKLPIDIFNRIISYKKFQNNNKFNKFIFSKNPELINAEEVKKEIMKEMRGILNKLTNKNLNIMTDKLNTIIQLVNKVKVKTEIHKILMSMLLQKAICEKNFSSVYAKFLQEMSTSIKIDYRDYLDNLFVDMKKLTKEDSSYSNDYNKFCKQLIEKDKILGLFYFIGELFKLKLLEDVLIKKYIIILYNNIIKSKLNNCLNLEINANCIKVLLNICNKVKFYELVYDKFTKMKTEKKYKMKFKFILMDIVEKYDRLRPAAACGVEKENKI